MLTQYRRSLSLYAGILYVLAQSLQWRIEQNRPREVLLGFFRSRPLSLAAKVIYTVHDLSHLRKRTAQAA